MPREQVQPNSARLADGSLLSPALFDIELNNNCYKKINNEWFIFGNRALYPLLGEDHAGVIEQLDYLLIIKEKEL